MAKESYNVQNQITGIFILTDQGVPVEYDPPQSDVQQVADNFTTQTGQQHIVVGPHPKPHA